jgi:hypothetical protein
MNENDFNEDDYQKFGELINFVTEKMVTTSLKTSEVVNYVRLLGHAQNQIAPKIYRNILEVQELKKPATSKSSSKSKAK